MKVLSSPQSPGQRSVRRKLKNPKVEKAEILESVVQFLKSDKEVDRVRTKEQTRARRNSYHDGMRTCLLRVSRFVATKGPGSEGTSGDTLQASFTLAEPHTHSPPPRHIHRALIPAAVADPAALAPQHLSHHHRQHGISQPVLTQVTGLHCETRKLLSPTAASIHITDPVWRPWPQ
ncbi:hypothetical protein INR49_028449 [Caranx melampygus]|nr:hypothetical protein INR49_028449 [Caranx melampygus]